MNYTVRINYKKIIIVSLLALAFVGCDQSAKQIARKHLQTSEMVYYIYGIVKFVYVENPGGMLSIGAQLSYTTRFYILVAGVSFMLSALFIYLLFKKRGSVLKDTALLLIFSGGAGNLTDRIFNDGRVIDFIIIGSSKLHTAVFNLADLFIIAGTLMFFISFSKRENINL